MADKITGLAHCLHHNGDIFGISKQRVFQLINNPKRKKAEESSGSK